MISVIVSSYNAQLFLALEKNISETIGTGYEIIKIHNPGSMGLCEAYNRGASRARFNYLLFLHEDVLFQTSNWGPLLIEHLNIGGVGVLGLAGSSYVPSAPSAWSISDTKYTYCQVNSISPNGHTDILRVKAFALDGVFLAVNKSIFESFNFDENIVGFHGYDTEYSLRVAKEFSNYVIRDIYITHLSKGKVDKLYLDNNIQIREKLGCDYNKIIDQELESKSFNYFLNTFFKYYQFNLRNVGITLRFLPWNVSCGYKFLIFQSYLRLLKSKLFEWRRLYMHKI